ncbi:hypothetical protein ACSLOV_25305, partial [Escherichia coli]
TVYKNSISGGVMNYEIKQEDKRTVAGFHLVGPWEQTVKKGFEQAWAPWIAELDIYRQDCAHVDIISPVAFEKIGPIIRATLNK